MLEPIVSQDTLHLRHCRWFLAAMSFGKAIVLNRCEQESEQEERKRAQGQKEWYRHDAKADSQMYVIATGLKDCLHGVLFCDGIFCE